MSSTTVAAPLPAGATPASEGVTATRNALTLGATMLAGTGIALVVRLVVVRLLGPESFGQLRFAENAAEMLFIGLTLGVDTLLRREAALDPARAQGYLSSINVLRLVVGGVLLTSISAALGLAGYGAESVALFAVLGAAQTALVLNNSYTAMEHASGHVGWIAAFTVRFKFLWAGLALAALVVFRSGLAFAFVFLGVELFKLMRLGVRHRKLAVPVKRTSLRAAGVAAAASLPFFVNYLAYSLYARLGIWWLGGTSTTQEVGWYGAASTVAAMAMLGMPLISWVLVPASARAGKNDPQGAAPLFEGALRLALLIAVPVSLVLGMAAPFWVQLLFGSAYVPATGALQALAPTFLLAYVATVCSITLIQQDRVGALAKVSVAGLVASVLLNAALIPWGAATLGVGGASTGAALATLATEVVVTAVLLRLSHAGAWSVSLHRTVVALAAGAALALLVNQALPTHWGTSLASAVAFAGVVLALGAVTRADTLFLRTVLRRNKRNAQQDS